LIYVLFGDDDYTKDQQVAKLKARLGDPTTVSMNLTQIDGDRLTVGALRESCDAMPFLAEKRLVIVRNFLTRFEPRKESGGEGEGPRPKRDKDLEDALKSYLPNLPESTGLVFVEDRFGELNPFYATINGASKWVKGYQTPVGPALQEWIRQQVKETGGQIAPQAAVLLAAYVTDGLHHLAMEIDKLVSFTNGKRTIEAADVENLVTEVLQSNIFQVVDAIAAHNGKRAIGLLHTLLDNGTSEIYVLSMITRQFRILLQVKEMSGAGATQQEMQSKLHLHSFVLEKGLAQARGFTMERLEAIYRRLVEVDASIKRGRLEPELALDLLVVDLAGAT
jgi:DNA polymerase III subunit delta